MCHLDQKGILQIRQFRDIPVFSSPAAVGGRGVPLSHKAHDERGTHRRLLCLAPRLWVCRQIHMYTNCGSFPLKLSRVSCEKKVGRGGSILKIVQSAAQNFGVWPSKLSCHASVTFCATLGYFFPTYSVLKLCTILSGGGASRRWNFYLLSSCCHSNRLFFPVCASARSSVVH